MHFRDLYGSCAAIKLPAIGEQGEGAGDDEDCDTWRSFMLFGGTGYG
jgi:hypothetical protein